MNGWRSIHPRLGGAGAIELVRRDILLPSGGNAGGPGCWCGLPGTVPVVPSRQLNHHELAPNLEYSPNSGPNDPHRSGGHSIGR